MRPLRITFLPPADTPTMSKKNCPMPDWQTTFAEVRLSERSPPKERLVPTTGAAVLLGVAEGVTAGALVGLGLEPLVGGVLTQPASATAMKEMRTTCQARWRPVILT